MAARVDRAVEDPGRVDAVMGVLIAAIGAAVVGVIVFLPYL